MCRFKSLIFTKNECYFLPENDSHEEIIKAHSLRDDRSEFLQRVGFLPKKSLTNTNINDWELVFDNPKQDWFDDHWSGERAFGELLRAIPDFKKYGGSLDLQGTQITALPEGLTVGGYLYLQGTQIKNIPKKFNGKIIK